MRGLAQETDSSEKLLQRGREEGQYMCDFSDGRVYAIKHVFFQNFSASLMTLSAGHEE